MDEERFRRSDLAEVLGVVPSTISKLAHDMDIQGEKEGIGRGKQTSYTLEQAEALARAYRGEEGVNVQ